MVLVFRILISNLPTIFSKSIIKIWLNLRKNLLPSSSFNIISSEDLGKKAIFTTRNKINVTMPIVKKATCIYEF